MSQNIKQGLKISGIIIIIAIIIIVGISVRMKDVNSHITTIENDLKNSCFRVENRLNNGELMSERNYEFLSNGTMRVVYIMYAYDEEKFEYIDEIEEEDVSGPYNFHVEGDIFGNYTAYATYINDTEDHSKGDLYGDFELTLNSSYRVTNIGGYLRTR